MKNHLELPSLYFFKDNHLDFEKVHNQTRLSIDEAFAKLNISASVVFLGSSLGFMKFRMSVMEDEDFPILSDYTEELSKILGVTVRCYDLDILEVPYNRVLRTIPSFSALDLTKLRNSSMTLPILLGMESETNYIVEDLTKFPHLLMGGMIGSGKSNCINSMILSLLLNFKPDELKLMLINPQVMELSIYNSLPHLLVPIITEQQHINSALAWCVDEMARRYQLLSKARVRNIMQYNDKVEIDEKLPYIVVMIDEFADLMRSAHKSQFHESVCRLCQKSRAVGIHLITATQYPVPDVISGVMKANMPSRIAFTVTTKLESRIILDNEGAECLIGQGDFLFRGWNTNELIRLQTPFIEDEDIEKIVKYWRDRSQLSYIEIPEYEKSEEKIELPDNELDPLFDEAIKFMRETNLLNISAIQQHFKIGFHRATTIMDQLEQKGIVFTMDNGRRYLL
ncbi:TPA: cell division protein FtsK [Pasteurella multocida]|nr:cell division protein FtsK [Pasteurella multocida]HDR1095192.1 cell division protein FtsK [Pasteurella multocida]